MGDLRNKRKKEEAEQAIRDREDRRVNGWTVYHFDFNPRLMRRNMTLGEAIRYMCRATFTKISWWRCPVRGLAIEYRKLPRTTYSYDNGERWMSLHFSDLDDLVEAKKALVVDALLRGIEEYRGLPNKMFDDHVALMHWLLKAPPSVSAEDWLKRRDELPERMREVLRTHESTLRLHLLGEKYTAMPDCPVKLTVGARLEAGKTSRRDGEYGTK